MRFTASQANLCTRRGCLGQALHLEKGHGATGIKRCVEDLVQEFCTPCFGAPSRSRQHLSSKKSKCDEGLKQVIMGAIEIYDPDRASDEQSAGRLMRNAADTFAGLKIVTYDHTHAARRTSEQTCRTHHAEMLHVGFCVLDLLFSVVFELTHPFACRVMCRTPCQTRNHSKLDCCAMLNNCKADFLSGSSRNRGQQTLTCRK